MKKRLFSMRAATVLEKDIPAIEDVDMQTNDSIFESMSAIYGRLLELVKNSDFKNNAEAFKDSDIADTFKELDNMISMRFGFTIKHVPSESRLFDCWPVSETLTNAAESGTNSIKDTLSGKGLDTKHAAVGVDDIDKDEASKNISRTSRAQFNELNKMNNAMNGGKMTVDRKRARITNAPKDLTVYMSINLLLIAEIDPAGNNMTSTVLHELGYIFGYTDYANSLMKVSYAIAKASQNANTDDEKVAMDELKSVYETELHGDAKDLDGLDAKELVALVQVAYDKAADLNQDDVMAEIDRQAEQFLSAFGTTVTNVLPEENGETGTGRTHTAASIFFTGILIVIRVLTVIMLVSWVIGAALVLSMGGWMYVVVSFAILILRTIIIAGIVRVLKFIRDKFTGKSGGSSSYTSFLKTKQGVAKEIKNSNLPKEVSSGYGKNMDNISQALKTSEANETKESKEVVTGMVKVLNVKGNVSSKLSAYKNSVSNILDKNEKALGFA